MKLTKKTDYDLFSSCVRLAGEDLVEYGFATYSRDANVTRCLTTWLTPRPSDITLTPLGLDYLQVDHAQGETTRFQLGKCIFY